MSTTLPFVGQTQTNLLHVLMRSAEALPIDEIAVQIGVTKTAARQHILNLQQGGYVQIVEPDISQKKSRGRPTYSYEISREGRELFARHYALFSEKMIIMLKNTLDEKQFKKQMQGLGKLLAEDLAHKMPKPVRGKTPAADTLESLAAILRELGYDAHKSTPNEITAHNCVFHKLAEKCEMVCEVDLSLMQKLTGKKPVHKECMVRDGKVCKFLF
ncbi:MAG: HTH domain-containing protein [Robiginitomaculum sp.]|nr:HTH domain-containing protein [Robiginitomaculum sp.]